MIKPENLFETPTGEEAIPVEGDSTLTEYLEQCERYFIIETLDRHGWQIATTARVLGISRKNLWERMRRLAIAATDTRDT